MSTLPRLAWRNVWRNPRRTSLTVAATVFAVGLVVFFVAMAAGLHEKWIEDTVRINSGHLSISGRDYLEKRTLEQNLHYDAAIAAELASIPGVEGFAPRVVGFGLLSKDSTTQGVAVVGVDPELESSVSTLAKRVREGAFVSAGDGREIVLGARLAERLNAQLGDELLLYSVAYSLEMAYELFRVVGIMKLPDPGLDRALSVISLADAQEFFVFGDRVSEIAILAADSERARSVSENLEVQLAAHGGNGEGLEVHTWRELMPELVQLVFLDDASMYIMLVILIVVVAFGILNTILMSVLERKREFGVALALGMRPSAIFRLVYLESIFLAVVGLALGLAVAIPLVLYFQANPITLTGEEFAGAMELFGVEPQMVWKLKPLNPIGSSLTILAVAALAALYPAVKASRARPVDALRSL